MYVPTAFEETDRGKLHAPDLLYSDQLADDAVWWAIFWHRYRLMQLTPCPPIVASGWNQLKSWFIIRNTAYRAG